MIALSHGCEVGSLMCWVRLKPVSLDKSSINRVSEVPQLAELKHMGEAHVSRVVHVPLW